MHPVPLTGRVVTLRDFRHDDAATALTVVGDDCVTNWLSYDSRDLDQATQMIDGAIERSKNNPRTEYYLAIEVERHFIGFCRLGLDGVRAAKLGYAIHANHWATATPRTPPGPSSSSASRPSAFTASRPPCHRRTTLPPSPSPSTSA
jgi:hypothetical protein